MNSQGNISFRVSPEQQDQIERAAQKAGKSVSDYAREVLGPWAASDLGERPALQAVRRAPSPVAVAAAARGMTRDQYRQFAAEALAQADLRGARATVLPPAPPKRPSGMYSITDSGARSVAPARRSSRLA